MSRPEGGQEEVVAMENAAALQARAELNALAMAKEFEFKQKEVELKLFTEDEETWIMTADLSIMDPMMRAWFEKKQKMIHDRDE